MFKEPLPRVPKAKTKLMTLNATEAQRTENNDYISDNLGLDESNTGQPETGQSYLDSGTIVSEEVNSPG